MSLDCKFFRSQDEGIHLWISSFRYIDWQLRKDGGINEIYAYIYWAHAMGKDQFQALQIQRLLIVWKRQSCNNQPEDNVVRAPCELHLHWCDDSLEEMIHFIKVSSRRGQLHSGGEAPLSHKGWAGIFQALRGEGGSGLGKMCNSL